MTRTKNRIGGRKLGLETSIAEKIHDFIANTIDLFPLFPVSASDAIKILQKRKRALLLPYDKSIFEREMTTPSGRTRVLHTQGNTIEGILTANEFKKDTLLRIGEPWNLAVTKEKKKGVHYSHNLLKTDENENEGNGYYIYGDSPETLSSPNDVIMFSPLSIPSEAVRIIAKIVSVSEYDLQQIDDRIFWEAGFDVKDLSFVQRGKLWDSSIVVDFTKYRDELSWKKNPKVKVLTCEFLKI